jgi:hypothetical protein
VSFFVALKKVKKRRKKKGKENERTVATVPKKKWRKIILISVLFRALFDDRCLALSSFEQSCALLLSYLLASLMCIAT